MATRSPRPGSYEEAARSPADVDRDSLHILPLDILPLAAPGLRKARMIKNAQLRSVVELFHGARTGSGQLEVADVAKEFDWPDRSLQPDLAMLRKVARLPSYDVYSLRISLRSLGIAVNEDEHLKLSPAMSRELAPYMTDFTRPLIVQIYGGDDIQIKTFEDVVRLFRDPDRGRALEKLRQMADALGIRPDAVPTFIEDYGDIFLALSYYRRCLDSVEPIVKRFRGALVDLRGNHSLQQDGELMRTFDHVQEIVDDRLKGVKLRMRTFDEETRDMWRDISAARFHELRARITRHHVAIGAVLCALTVKMSAWQALFPDDYTGGPRKRAEFIMTELRQGMDGIQRLELASRGEDRRVG